MAGEQGWTVLSDTSWPGYEYIPGLVMQGYTAIVREALAELPEDQREVLQLRLEQELSLEEIGQITGVGRETVKSRLRYALDKLRARLNP